MWVGQHIRRITPSLINSIHIILLLLQTSNMDANEQDCVFRVFCYKNYSIDKSQSLGSGSFGRVYKATCDELPCVAKIFHPTVIDTLDPGSGRITERFENECAYLRSMQHPNIVQFLGVHWDDESRLPGLFMEVLDENLTSMLERSLHPLAFHVQVDICHDIALALAYLHSNGLIHRDLSSNNVLIVARRRAKVTDFGMMKLASASPATTSISGTLAYMPPEAFQDPPSYSMKLDCFSEGVIIIQVCTRCFPDPGPRVRHELSEKSATGSIDIPILETERRKNHIDLIDSSNPLLAIAIDCLHYLAKDRPSASELSQRMAHLKKGKRYTTSISQTQEEMLQLTKAEQQIHELHQQFKKQEEIIQDLKERNSELQRRLEDVLTPSPKFNPSASVLLDWSEVDLSPKPRFNMIRGAAVVDGSIAYFMNSGGEICLYNSINNTWNDLPTCPLFGSSLAVVNDLVTAVGGEEKISKAPITTLISLETKDGETSWVIQEQYQPIPTPRSFTSVVCARNSLIVAGGKKGWQYGQTYLNTVEIMDTENGTWCSAARLPYPYSRMSVTVCRDKIYMLGGYGLMGRARSVVSCSIDSLLQSRTWSSWIKSGLTFKPVWSLVANLPQYRFATAVSINDQLYALGGCSSKHERATTKRIHKYNVGTNSWEYVGDMPRSVQRCLAAVLPANKLIVLGGGVNSEDDQGSNNMNIANILQVV